MATYVLIHGASHGGWCWKKIVPLLEMRGHHVEAPDLPGHGEDKTPVRELSLHAYVDKVCKVLDAQSEPVILVGHSLGGVVISQAAEYRPKKIRTLVFLSAFLLRNGESLKRSLNNERSMLNISWDQGCLAVKDELVKEFFYGDCSDEDAGRARALLVPEAIAVFKTPIQISENNFVRIPRVYIECLRDNAVLPAVQKKLYTETPCQQVISMDTCHSPFFSAPEKLADHLAKLGN